MHCSQHWLSLDSTSLNPPLEPFTGRLLSGCFSSSMWQEPCLPQLSWFQTNWFWFTNGKVGIFSLTPSFFYPKINFALGWSMVKYLLHSGETWTHSQGCTCLHNLKHQYNGSTGMNKSLPYSVLDSAMCWHKQCGLACVVPDVVQFYPSPQSKSLHCPSSRLYTWSSGANHWLRKQAHGYISHTQHVLGISLLKFRLRKRRNFQWNT